MKNEMESQKKLHILSKAYWCEAAKNVGSVRMLAFAALIVALRVAVKLFRIPITGGLFLTFDCYINSLGSLVYGPLMALLVGAVSDTLGCVIAPSGAYFLPFILVEMSSSFIFALFFWNRKITVGRTLLSKFTVNFICNIILTSVITKWNYFFFGDEKAYSYAIINGVRIVKNLVMFPIESVLIVLIFGAMVPVLKKLKMIASDSEAVKLSKKHIPVILLLLLFSVGLILFYVFFLKDFVNAHNFKFLV